MPRLHAQHGTDRGVLLLRGLKSAAHFGGWQGTTVQVPHSLTAISGLCFTIVGVLISLLMQTQPQ